MARTVEQAARELVEAEWFFRLGPRAYQGDVADNLVRAERRLRRALTGKGELGEAYQEIDRCRDVNERRTPE